MLSKHEKMRSKYCDRANELLRQAASLEEDDFEIPVAPAVESQDVGAPQPEDAVFPDFAVAPLIAMVEGSKLPLSTLSLRATEKLNEMYNNEDTTTKISSFDLESTSEKIKLLASRKNYIKNPFVASGMPTLDDGSPNKKKVAAAPVVADLFEDNHKDYMWYVHFSLFWIQEY